jgi:hypothetical protein
MIRKTLVVAALVVAAAAFTGAAQAARPSAFVAGFQFCHAFDTKTLAMRFSVKPTTAAVSAQVGRWFTWQIKGDHAAYRYPVRYQRIIALGCTRGLRA